MGEALLGLVSFGGSGVVHVGCYRSLGTCGKKGSGRRGERQMKEAEPGEGRENEKAVELREEFLASGSGTSHAASGLPC